MEKPLALVADDDEPVRRLITALLQRDFIIDPAMDGMETIAKLKRRQYAVVLLDLVMPQVNGYAVLDFLRSTQPWALNRVIVMTASVSARERERVGRYEVYRVVSKPFDVSEFRALAKECASSDLIA